MEKMLQKIYPTYFNLLMAQDLWQVHYQILSIILNVISVMMIKNVKHVELIISIATVNSGIHKF